MKWSTVLPLAISAISLLPVTGAWEITWNDADNEKHSRTGHGPSNCIEIDNPKGHVFKIDSQGETGINMLLFPNSQCKGDEVGSATKDFTKESSRDLLGFRVVSLWSSSSSQSTAANSTVASSTDTKSLSSVESARSTTTRSIAATTSAGTKTPGASSATVPSTSTTPATTSNAAVQMGVPNGSAAMGVVGSILGAAFVQWII